MYTVKEIEQIVSNCRFNYPHETWLLEVKMDGTRTYLQVHAIDGRDSESGKTIEWTGRKWMLSPYMCKNEIVTTAFKAIMTAIEHEVRESFLYKGVPIFNPHIDPDRMAEFVSDANNMQSRDNIAFGV